MALRESQLGPLSEPVSLANELAGSGKISTWPAVSDNKHPFISVSPAHFIIFSELVIRDLLEENWERLCKWSTECQTSHTVCAPHRVTPVGDPCGWPWWLPEEEKGENNYVLPPLLVSRKSGLEAPIIRRQGKKPHGVPAPSVCRGSPGHREKCRLWSHGQGDQLSQFGWKERVLRTWNFQRLLSAPSLWIRALNFPNDSIYLFIYFIVTWENKIWLVGFGYEIRNCL